MLSLGCVCYQIVVESRRRQGPTPMVQAASSAVDADQLFDKMPEPISQWAILRSRKGEYHGAMATLNVYALNFSRPTQMSTVLIRIANFGTTAESFNSIVAGWHVYPKLYGDYDTYFFTHWAADIKGKTGCYNLKCEGFVSTSEDIPGRKIRPLSTYNGDQYYINIKISKDRKTGDWWLYSGTNVDTPLGYWPKSLFTTLADSAFYIQWGGVVLFYKDEQSPPMGSGHFPSEGQGRAASMSNIRYVGTNGKLYAPDYFVYEDKKECYSLIPGKEVHLLGGPGGCPVS